MKKLIKIVKSFEWLILLWVVTCVTLAVLKIFDYTSCSWYWISTPLYVPILGSVIFLVLSWLAGFFYLIGKDLYGRYYGWRAMRLAKQIEKGITKAENELKNL